MDDDPHRQTDDRLPNRLAVEGTGTPASFEITVDGTVEVERAESPAGAPVVSGSAVEGAISEGTVWLRFSGAVVDATVRNGGAVADGSSADPEIYVVE